MAAATIAEKFAGVTSPEVAAEIVKSVGSAHKRHLNAGDSKMVDAAYATWKAVEFGLIREGRKGKDDAPVRWEHAEYANLYDGGRGTVKSVIGAWIVLGYALVVLDLAPDSQLFKQLRKGVEFGKVKTAVRAAQPTPESIAELQTYVDMWVNENGSKKSLTDRIEAGTGEVSNARPEGNESQNGSDTGDKAETGALVIDESNAVDVVKVSIDSLRKAFFFLTDEDYAKVKRTIPALLKSEDKRRADAKAADLAATA